MKSSSKRRWLAAAVLLLLLFLLRPGASRLKSRIIASISSGVGRSVDISSVRLRLLPRPGFDLENLVVYDDAAFGPEPMLRSADVSASLRLMSLVQGRIEIARLDLTEPSLNLVRGENGHWNVETLLERTAHTPLAPTAKGKSGLQPGFPYIEATSARINFKNGPEKKPYALTSADFSLWQDSENAWGVRLKAQPVRTDLNLNDTGILRVNGKWERAPTLRDTPLEFSIDWQRGQLGQITKLLSGRDQGWRGDVTLQLSLAGTPAKLRISSDTSLEDFRRYDITTGDPLRLAAHCDAVYSSVDRIFHEVLCQAPVQGGLIEVKGSTALPGNHNYDWMITAEDVPASALVPLVRRAKKDLPEDLVALGTLRGTLTVARTPMKFSFKGHGQIADLQIASRSGRAEVGPETFPFIFSSADASQSRPGQQSLLKGIPRTPPGPHVEFGPFSPGGTRAAARGWIDRSGYSISLTGDSDIAKILRIARLLGIPALQPAVEGSAQLDLHIAGAWAGWGYGAPQGFSGPQITGTAKLRNTHISFRGAAAPVEVAGADLQLLPDRVRVQKLTAEAANTVWTGTLEMPRGCGTPANCQVQFSLNANRVALGELGAWASPSPKARPWYRVLEASGAPRPYLADVRAAGRLTVSRLEIHGIPATHVAANVVLDAGKLTISELTADLLGGEYLADWQADFTVKPATSSSSGTWSGLSLAAFYGTETDPQIRGRTSGSYQLSAAGSSEAEFWRSLGGTLKFDVKEGSMANVSLENDQPLQITRFSGLARLHAGKIETKDAKLDSPNGIFQVSGTTSFGRELEIRLVPRVNASAGYFITGTLADPRIQPISGAEQARLKP